MNPIAFLSNIVCLFIVNENQNDMEKVGGFYHGFNTAIWNI
ncbi:hypothetical protein SAMN02745181_0114 [Rubritalea squalenifaciens DSM 18772]|uniref:Uncharacterized protein n=1 Tax=Rubritalea squalenifaciens DSM 18772 TaxID=1123071 RepID=A0A1M6B441_9BACT|nr:hypothetical protein SAMN02745181_0114 [Rubritalea squalenifaciens DSM 18772]